MENHFSQNELLDFIKFPERQSQSLINQIERHLESCQTCREYVDELERQASGEFSFLRCFSDKISKSVSEGTPDIQERKTEPPFRVGVYEVIELIGRGGMGEVYLAWHTLLKRKAAIKFIRRAGMQNSQAVETFQREIAAAGKLQHPNIVTAHDAGQYNSQPFLVMEYLQGQTIKEKIQTDGAVSISQACDIIIQAAEGLAYAHKKGLIHRDVKPANLWSAPGGAVKVLDLGLAVFQNETMFQVVHVAGTPDFMSPEQCQANTIIDSRSDIYSLGCVFFYILTGQTPFEKSKFLTIQEKINAYVFNEFPAIKTIRKDVPARLQKIIEKMTAKTPGNRYASMNAVIEDIKRFQTQRQNRGTNLLTLFFFTFIAVSAIAYIYFYKSGKPEEKHVVSISENAMEIEQATPENIKAKPESVEVKTIQQDVPSNAKENNPISAMTAEQQAEYDASCARESFQNAMELRQVSQSESTQRGVFNYLLTSAELGYPPAQTQVGLCYQTGEGVEKNREESVKWISKAAENKDPLGLALLGYMYDDGVGVKQDLKKAVDLINESAELGLSESQFYMALAYDQGRGVKKNTQSVLYWLEKAANQNHLKSCYWLGLIYETGDGVAVDNNQAQRWYLKAASLGNLEAQRSMARRFYEKEKYAQAFDWFKKAALQNDAHSVFMIGVLLQEGRGVPKNLKKGFDFILKAARMGDKEAMSFAGQCYQEGLGVEKNANKSVFWLQKAEDEFPEAQEILNNPLKYYNTPTLPKPQDDSAERE